MGLTCELTYGDVSSKELGLTVEGYPSTVLPQKDVEVEEIPGRNGDLLYDYGTYRSYEQEYTLHWRVDNDPKRSASIAAWIQQKGYNKLVDSFHAGKYRLAYCTGGVEVENRMNVLGRTGIAFVCRPEWFLDEGDTELTLSNGQTLSNEWEDAKPLITIKGSGAGVLTVGDVIVTASNIPADGIVLDSDLQDAYSPSKLENRNALVSLSGDDFPILRHGDTRISWTGGIESVTLIPHWWCLL